MSTTLIVRAPPVVVDTLKDGLHALNALSFGTNGKEKNDNKNLLLREKRRQALVMSCSRSPHAE